MMRLGCTKHLSPLIAQHRLSDHHHHGSDCRHPQQQQQQLFEDDPLLVPLLALQQKVHGSPFHATMPQHIDQMDQYRQRHDGQAKPD